MLFLPVDGAETPITIEDRAQLEALIGSDKLVQIGVTGGKVLVFSEESPVMRDDEPFYPQRNNRASHLRRSRVTGNAVLGSVSDFEFDKYEGVQTMACRACRETVEYSPDSAYCETCLSDKKRGASTIFALVAVFVAGWAIGGVSPLARAMMTAGTPSPPMSASQSAPVSMSQAAPMPTSVLSVAQITPAPPTLVSRLPVSRLPVSRPPGSPALSSARRGVWPLGSARIGGIGTRPLMSARGGAMPLMSSLAVPGNARADMGNAPDARADMGNASDAPRTSRGQAVPMR